MYLTKGKSRGFVVMGDPDELREASCWLGASYRRKEGVVRLPESISSWKVLRDVQFDDMSPGAVDTLDELKRRYREHRRSVRNAFRKFKLTGETDIPVPLKTVPYEHQVRGYGFAEAVDQSALFMDQGTGKTMCAIAVVGRRHLDEKVHKVLVVCPKSVKPVWPREFKKHAGFDYTISVDRPPGEGNLQIWVTNYDRVKRELKRLRKWKPDMVILDESHRIKNRKAARTKAVIQLGAKVPYKLLLSGTPFGKCISEVWSQYKFLNPGIFGSNFSEFKENYLRMGGYMGYKVVGYKNEDDFSEKLHSVAFRVTKDECLDLPPISYQRMYVEPDALTRKVYQELEDDLYSEVDGEEVSVDREATKQIKLRQIVGGIVKSDTQALAKVSGLKMSTLEEVMEDRPPDKKTVIFFSFTHEILSAQEMCKKLRLGYITLQGSTPEKERDTFEDRFQNDPEVRVALIQVQTGGEGMTLTAADMAIFYSPTFSFIGYSQCRDRIRRIGQLFPVTILFIIFENTVDERVVDVLECNGQLVDRYLESNRNYSLGDTTMSEGYTAKELAEEFEITPAELRKHLRAVGATKPEGGWTWPKKTDKDLVEIRKNVKARIKELEDKGSDKPAKSTAKSPAKKTSAKKTKAAKETEEAPKKVRRSRKAKQDEE